MVINGCEVVVVVTGLAVDCVASVLIGSFCRFVAGGLLVGNVSFLLINGRTGASVTRLVGLVSTIDAVGRFDETVTVVVAAGLRVVFIGLGVVVVIRTTFFVVDKVSFVGLLLSLELGVGLCLFVGLTVVVVGRL